MSIIDVTCPGGRVLVLAGGGPDGLTCLLDQAGRGGRCACVAATVYVGEPVPGADTPHVPQLGDTQHRVDSHDRS